MKGLLFRGHDLSEKAVLLWCFRAPFVHTVIILQKKRRALQFAVGNDSPAVCRLSLQRLFAFVPVCPYRVTEVVAPVGNQSGICAIKPIWSLKYKQHFSLFSLNLHVWVKDESVFAAEDDLALSQSEQNEIWLYMLLHESSFNQLYPHYTLFFPTRWSQKSVLCCNQFACLKMKTTPTFFFFFATCGLLRSFAHNENVLFFFWAEIGNPYLTV